MRYFWLVNDISRAPLLQNGTRDPLLITSSCNGDALRDFYYEEPGESIRALDKFLAVVIEIISERNFTLFDFNKRPIAIFRVINDQFPSSMARVEDGKGTAKGNVNEDGTGWKMVEQGTRGEDAGGGVGAAKYFVLNISVEFCARIPIPVFWLNGENV